MQDPEYEAAKRIWIGTAQEQDEATVRAFLRRRYPAGRTDGLDLKTAAHWVICVFASVRAKK